MLEIGLRGAHWWYLPYQKIVASACSLNLAFFAPIVESYQKLHAPGIITYQAALDMAHDGRPSPRVAIRTWLQQLNSNSMLETNCYIDSEHSQEPRPHLSRKHQNLTSQIDYRGHPKRVASGGSGKRLQCDPNKSVPNKSHKEEPQDKTRKPLRLGPGEPGFAERLGLHAPFRTFKDQDEDTHVIREDSTRTRKRKRKVSSTISYLEPAVVDEPRAVENGRRIPHESEKTKRPPPSNDDRNLESLPGLLQTSNELKNGPNAPLEKLTKSYERQPRRKTREDRYELKDGFREKKQVAKKHGQDKSHHKKHRRKEKSGAALMHSFTAQNVSHGRLTLQPTKALGLFGKGRASSPVRRRDLPNLAFSEAAFLNSHRAKSEDTADHLHSKFSDKKKKRKTTKAADIEEEISRYFTSAKAPSRSAPDRHSQFQEQIRQQQAPRRLQTSDSPPSFIELPNKPFLGFGSSGAVSVSPVRRLDSRALRDHEHRLDRSPTHFTSCFTWSQSGIRSLASPKGGDHELASLVSSHYFNRRRSSLASSKTERPEPPKSSQTVRQLSGSYRDAATGITPPSRHSKDTLRAPTGSQLLKDVRSDSGIHARDHVRARETRVEANDRPSGAEPMSKERLSGHSSTGRTEPKLHQSSPSDANSPHIVIQRRKEAYTGTAQAFPAHGTCGFPDPSHLDPLEAVLDQLLQEGNHRSTVGGVLSTSVSQGQHNIDPGKLLRVDSGLKVPPNKPSPGVNSRPITDRPYNPSLQVEDVASRLNSVDGHSWHDHDTVVESHNGQALFRTHSRYSVGPLKQPRTMQLAPGPLPTTQTRRVASRSARNDYDAIHERQQSRDHRVSLEGQGFNTDNLRINSESHEQPDTNAIPLANQKYEPGTSPIGVEDHFNDYNPGVHRGQNFFHNSHEYAKNDLMLEDELAYEFNDHGTWADVSHPSLIEPDNELKPGGLTYSHCDVPQLQHKNPVYSERSEQIEHNRSVATTAPGFNIFRRSSFDSMLPSVAESTSIAQGHMDHQHLSHFWTPHKLY